MSGPQITCTSRFPRCDLRYWSHGGDALDYRVTMAGSFTPRTSQGVPIPVEPAADGQYARTQWEEETFALFAEGGDPPACPQCGRTGFYGPRVSDRVGEHRACRFCGFFQEVKGEVQRATPCVHDCTDWPEVAKAPYIWWLEPGRDAFTCAFCGDACAADSARITAPVDDDDHPWWRVPQARSRFYYARLWENWPFTKGRVFL